MKKVMASTLALTALTLGSAALAGSLAPAAEPAPIAPAAQAHDWTGWYGDIYWGRWVNPAVGNFGGFNLGYNMANGALIYGGEIGYFYDPSLASGNAQIAGRIGTAIGDNAMAFGRAGYEQDFPGGNLYLLGLGGQAAVTGNTYLRGEFDWEFPVGGGAPDTSLRLGLGWEF